MNATTLQEATCLTYEQGVDTDGGYGTYATGCVDHPERAVTELLDTGDSVATFKGSIVDARKETA